MILLRYFLSTTEINERLKFHDWWKKSFWSVSWKLSINISNIQKIESGPGNDYTTGCSLDYPYLKKYYKMIAIVLSK